MKVFWALVAVLVLGAAVMAVRSAGGPASAAKADRAAAAAPEGPVGVEVLSPTVVDAGERPAEPGPRALPSASPVADDEAAALPAAGEAVAQPKPSSEPQPDPLPEVPAAPAEPAPAEPGSAEAAPAPTPEAPLPAELEKLVAETIGSAEAPAAVPAPAAGAPAEAAPMVVEQADGSKLIAGRFILKGEGTKEKPYEVTWDMLVSAQETYKPRLGQKTLPAYLDMLHGKYVTIGGFVAFPLMAQSADEMLVMLNQWDGCCIGIPPTPYDAVEVRLKTAAEGETRFKVTGSVTGKFAVDPYLVRDWLIGLYTMEDAELTTD